MQKNLYAKILFLLLNHNMMTITDYASKKGIKPATIYSWIYRGQAEQNGFRVHQIGKMKLIEEIVRKRIKRAVK